MFSQHRRGKRRAPSSHPLLFLIGFAFLMLVPAVDTVAQGFQIAAQPTAEPTEEPTFEPPLQAQPTAEPTAIPEEEEPPRDVPPQETEIDTLVQATEEPVDPPREDPSGTITVHKAVCDDPGFDFYDPEFLGDMDNFINHAACGPPDGEFEFTVSDGEMFLETEPTSLGTVQFVVPVGHFDITETVPAGWSDPVAYCWSNLLAAAVNNGTIGDTMDWSIADGENAKCWFFNIADPEVDSVHTIRVSKYTCPDGFDQGSDWMTFSSECTTPDQDVEFTLDVEGATDARTTDASGQIEWQDVALGPTGQVGIDEDIPAGYGEPVVWCVSFPEAAADPEDFDIYQVDSLDGQIVVTPEQHYPWIFSCTYFNIPAEPVDVTIYKWTCPEDYDVHAEGADPMVDCTEATNGVDFRFGIPGLDQLAMLQTTGETIDGAVFFPDVEIGTYLITEFAPDGIVGAFVGSCTTNGAPIPANPPLNEGFEWELKLLPDQDLVCHWYNIPSDDGSVTILKWTCPAGYDLNAAGADPKTDCTESTNGIQFQFGLDTGLEAEAVLQTTGDVIPGGVFFDDLEPDTYKAVELVPEGIASVFVLECTGHLMGVLQPYPLQAGNVLSGIDVDAEEHLVCHWYNVPESDGGTLTVVKYLCTTETFVSEVDCEIYEDGQTFDLYVWDGSDYVYFDTGTTDGVGVLSWIDLVPGTYLLDELDADWCHVVPGIVPEDDINGFIVNAGEENVIEVYNCGGEPGTPGDTPTKFPNTGVPPASRDDRLIP